MVWQVGERRRRRLDPEADRRAGMDDEARPSATRRRSSTDASGRRGRSPRAGTSRRSIGKSGGEKEREMRSRRLSSGDGGPQMSSFTRSSQSGAKKRRPSRWSRCRCVSRRWRLRTPRSASSRPSRVIPVPASRTRSPPSAKRDLDAGRVPAVADGVRPRCRHGTAAAPDLQAHRGHHHSRQKIATIPTNSSACAKSGKAVTATSRSTPSRLVIRKRSCAARRSSNAIRAGHRSGGRGSSSSRPRLEARRQFVQRHLAGLGEGPADDLLRCLVVEDELAPVVGDQGRRGEVRRRTGGRGSATRCLNGRSGKCQAYAEGHADGGAAPSIMAIEHVLAPDAVDRSLQPAA